MDIFVKIALLLAVLIINAILSQTLEAADYASADDSCSVLKALEDKSAEVQFLKRQIQAMQDQLKRRKDVLSRIKSLEMKASRIESDVRETKLRFDNPQECGCDKMISFILDGGPGGRGAVYTRWGRTTCPRSSYLIYDGFAGGSFVTYGGGGANYVCLPKDPQWAKTVPGRQECVSLMFGAEYQSCAENDHIFSRENADSNSIYDQDVPCAVCQSSGRLTQLMIPARTECPVGWVREYFGYLMSSHYEHKRTEWVCVDPSPEIFSRGSENMNGALFYFVEAACGSLPCPPYQDGQELTCVVCTK